MVCVSLKGAVRGFGLTSLSTRSNLISKLVIIYSTQPHRTGSKKALNFNT